MSMIRMLSHLSCLKHTHNALSTISTNFNLTKNRARSQRVVTWSESTVCLEFYEYFPLFHRYLTHSNFLSSLGFINSLQCIQLGFHRNPKLSLYLRLVSLYNI